MGRLGASKKRPSEIAELLIALRNNYVESIKALDELLEEHTEESLADDVYASGIFFVRQNIVTGTFYCIGKSDTTYLGSGN